jgi:hypothetical protein
MLKSAEAQRLSLRTTVGWLLTGPTLTPSIPADASVCISSRGTASATA